MNVDFLVVVPDLVLGAISTDVISNISPRADTVDLATLEEQKLLISSPSPVEYREGVLFYDSVRVRCWLVGVARGAFGEALDAEVVVVTSSVCASYPDLRGREAMSAKVSKCDIRHVDRGLWTPGHLRPGRECQAASREKVGCQTHSGSNVHGAHITNILNTSLATAGGRFLSDDSHGGC